MKVHIVFRAGVEWNDVIDVYEDKAEANGVAQRLEENKDKSDETERLSDYIVETYTVKKKKGGA